MLPDMGKRVLVVEDEADIAFPLVRTLEREGYDVGWVETGREALDDRRCADPADVVILDLGLPDMDGLEVCRRARESGFTGAIMIVTARAGELDRVVGLDYGADDYLAKPFGLAELQARVRALLRRTAAAPRPRPTEAVRRPAHRRGRPPGLRRRRRGAADRQGVRRAQRPRRATATRWCPRARLMADVWDENWYGSTKTLDVTIGRLRQKLEGVGVERAGRGRSRRRVPPRRRTLRCVTRPAPSRSSSSPTSLLLGAGVVRSYDPARPDPRPGGLARAASSRC